VWDHPPDSGIHCHRINREGFPIHRHESRGAPHDTFRYTMLSHEKRRDFSNARWQLLALKGRHVRPKCVVNVLLILDQKVTLRAELEG
jgi:hypothetical protein